jgi:micrococcal nuclease
VVVLAALALAPPHAFAGIDECFPPGDDAEMARVAVAIDGDTVRLDDGRLVRLAGVEAPRLPLAESGRGFVLGERAKAALAALTEGEPIRLSPTKGGVDRYGRLHGYLRLADGRSVGAEMVAAGLARVHPAEAESLCLPVLLGMEATARGAGLGLWADPEFAVRRAQDSSLRSRNGLYELVEGRVTSIGHGSRMVFLDFGRDIRHDFTVMMPLSVADKMAATGVAVDDLAGRKIRVRGNIEDSGGPAIRVNDVAEIELID